MNNVMYRLNKNFQEKNRTLVKAFFVFTLVFGMSPTVMGQSKSETVEKLEANTKLHQLFDREWQSRLERNPVMASSFGVKAQNDNLTDVSPEGYQKWKQTSENFLNEAKQFKSKELSATDQINLAIFKQQLEYRIASIASKDYELPFLSDSGFHTEIARLPVETEFNTLDDYQSYLNRLEKVPAYFSQQQANMNAGLSRNYAMPKVVMIGFTDVIKKVYEAKTDDSVFWKPFIQLPNSISEKKAKKLRLRAKKVINESVKPAFKKLADYFDNIYIPNTKKSLAANDFPDGENYYQKEVDHYTTVDLSAKAIHEIGLKEVARIRDEMEKIIRTAEFQGSFAEFLTFLRTSPQFYAKTEVDLLKEASYIAKKMDGQLPKFFTKLPRQPYTVEAVPVSIAPKYTTGRYLSAPLDSTRPGTYWVNTYALDKRPLYVLESLTLHEAVPGHHLQGALNQELEGLPNFRRYSYISAFGEGWALYCEKLGLEAGFYQDPYSNFGRLSYEMWRAARLVIDTGIHSMGWSREQAIKLLEENSALSTHNIRTEVDRYISWPGQALSYKLGELKILELRKKAEKALGDKFDIRLFHDAILANGSIPLNVLESQINLFIESQLNTNNKEKK